MMPRRLLRKLANYKAYLEEQQLGGEYTNRGKINEFEPKKKIVVTPAKMAMYYTSHVLDTEPKQLLCTIRI